MGERVLKQFRGEFPIRFDYLDTMEGGSLSIQVHPDTPYIHSQFGEPYHQGESYYIIAAKPGSRVYLGLKGQADEEKFRRLVRRSKRSGLPFDHQRYVNSLPSKVGDLFLIPPGTIHASGANQVVLEISATTYRYTFKLYDYLRPNLDGTMRPIHADHGFAQVRFSRRTDWVKQHLKQPPRLIRSGSGWSEYSLGDVRGLFHTAHRLEFSRQVPDAATDRFHILTIVEGEKAEIRSRKHPRRRRAFGFSETVIVPACFGEYTIRNLGRGKCKVVKSFVK
jgi:mannose-6-phosphate isomerase class I